MPSSLILLQPQRYLKLAPGATGQTQAAMMAANVLDYQFVTPFVRVVRSADNSLNTNGVKFYFQTAPLLSSPEDEETHGSRFVTIPKANFSVDVSGTAIVGAGVNGATYGPGNTSGALNTLQNLGGLVIWTCDNSDNTVINVLNFEIHLVCR